MYIPWIVLVYIVLCRYIGEGPVEIISTPDSSLHFTSEPEDNDEDVDISDIESCEPISGGKFSNYYMYILSNLPLHLHLPTPPPSSTNPTITAFDAPHKVEPSLSLPQPNLVPTHPSYKIKSVLNL